jgi:hypothetical protein
MQKYFHIIKSSAAEVSSGMDVPGLKDVAGFVAEHDEAA